jgi:hypothetical protein
LGAGAARAERGGEGVAEGGGGGAEDGAEGVGGGLIK